MRSEPICATLLALAKHQPQPIPAPVCPACWPSLLSSLLLPSLLSASRAATACFGGGAMTVRGEPGVLNLRGLCPHRGSLAASSLARPQSVHPRPGLRAGTANLRLLLLLLCRRGQPTLAEAHNSPAPRSEINLGVPSASLCQCCFRQQNLKFLSVQLERNRWQISRAVSSGGTFVSSAPFQVADRRSFNGWHWRAACQSRFKSVTSSNPGH